MNRLAVPLLAFWLIAQPGASDAAERAVLRGFGATTPQMAEQSAKKPLGATTPRPAKKPLGATTPRIAKQPAESHELLASWYSKESLIREGTWKRSHGRMANGRMFDEREYTCATWLYPLGTTLEISYTPAAGVTRTVRVLVSDRIARRFAFTRIDLSAAAFDRLADRRKGIIKVKVRRIE